MAEETKKIVLLCGANGTGKSTIAKRLESQGFTIFDVDGSNFYTSKKIEKYYPYFLDYLLSKSKEPFKPTFDAFKARFTELYDELNKDASLVLFTMYEKLTGTKIEDYKEREKAIDDLYKQVMAPVYEEDTLRNIIKALYEKPSAEICTGEALPIIMDTLYKAVLDNKLQDTIKKLLGIKLEQPNKICIDVGSRKFFFVDEPFLEQLKQFGYEPQVIFLDIDLDKNVDNLFNKHDDTFVLFDRLNLTGVVINCLNCLLRESEIEPKIEPEIKTNLTRILAQTEDIKKRNRELTKLIEDNERLYRAVETAIKTYMEVRHETLKKHLQYLTGHLGEKEKPSTITIGAEDGTKELFTKLFEKLSTPSEYVSIEPPTNSSVEVSEALNGAEASELGAELEGSELEAELEGSELEAELEAPKSEERLSITPIPMRTNASAICVMSF